MILQKGFINHQHQHLSHWNHLILFMWKWKEKITSLPVFLPKTYVLTWVQSKINLCPKNTKFGLIIFFLLKGEKLCIVWHITPTDNLKDYSSLTLVMFYRISSWFRRGIIINNFDFLFNEQSYDNKNEYIRLLIKSRS